MVVKKNQNKWWNFTKKEIIQISISLVVGGIISLLVGLFINNYIPKNEKKIIYENKIKGTNQESIKKLDHVKIFSNYLDFIKKRDTLNAWNIMADELKKVYQNDKLNWLYSYHLTHDYDILYVMPITDENFYVMLEFKDFVAFSEVEILKNFLHKRINEHTKFIINHKLVDCVYAFIGKRFELNPDNINHDKEYIYNYMSNRMSFNDFVKSDWRFPIIIAEQMRLPLKATLPRLPLGEDPQRHTMLCNIEMVFENNQWKVKRFRTVAISRWE